MKPEAVTARRILQAGDTLFSEGDRGDFAYYVEHGEIGIYVERDGERQQVASRPAGELIGEMAIIDDAPRSAAAVAIRHTEVLAISKGQLQRRLNAADPILKACVNTVLWRFRNLLASASLEDQNGKADTGRETLKLAILDDEVFGALTLESDLQTALQDGQLELHYQPIMDLETGNIAGFEALMRWEHPEKGAISPARFIPVAEAAGLVPALTRHALTSAIKALEAMNAVTPAMATPLFMSVNISGHDLEDDSFVDFLHWALDEALVLPRQIKLEVTETALMTDPVEAAARLSRCRDLGCGVSIDDFGAGYSSLSYLRTLPFDTLKIDRAFIAAMEGDEGARGLVRTILTLAREFGARVVAEGVETLDEALFLRESGCDYAQGWYFARAESLNTILTILSDNSATSLRGGRRAHPITNVVKHVAKEV